MKGKIKRNLKDWFLVLAFLLDEVAAAVIILVVLWLLDVEISPPIIIAIVLVLGGFIFLTHKAIIPNLRRKKITGSDGMVGSGGEVVESLKPVGVVRIEGEYWKARSVEGDIDAGDFVVIRSITKLVLEVRRCSDDDIQGQQ